MQKDRVRHLMGKLHIGGIISILFNYRGLIRKRELEKCEQWGVVMHDIINRKPLTKQQWDEELKHSYL